VGNDRLDYVVRGRIVEWDARRVRAVEDVLTSWDAIQADPAVLDDSGLLIDNGESDFDVPGGDVTRLAQAVALRLPKICAVAIVVSRSVHYGMARQFQAFADQGRATIQVFRDIEEARTWLAGRIAPPSPGDPAPGR
jgi:hypothetical protein